MMNIKVSIVMPSYNVIHYIEECLESVVNQSLKDIEIICVDAFSNDGTREVIQKYAKEDRRIILVDDDKKSCGYSYNKGIALAKGQYIGFVETDDYIRPDMFEILYKQALENQLDYVKANHIPFINIDEYQRYFKEERIFGVPELKHLYGKIINPSEHPEILWPDHCMWNGIYDINFLKKNKVKLNESKGASYQDHGFQWQTMCSAKRALYLDEGLYYYRKDNENASMKNPQGMIKDFDEFVFVKKYLEHNPAILREHWWVYYQKLLGTIRNWSCNLLIDNETLPEEFNEVYEQYRSELKKGYENGYLDPVKIGFGQYEELHMLLKSKEFYLSYLYQSIQVRISYQKHVAEKLRNKKNIVIIGAGDYGRKLFVTLKKYQLDNICSFADNDSTKYNTKMFGKMIMSVENAVQQYPDADFVIANALYYMDIMRQLVNIGITPDRISYYKITDMELF